MSGKQDPAAPCHALAKRVETAGIRLDASIAPTALPGFSLVLQGLYTMELAGLLLTVTSASSLFNIIVADIHLFEITKDFDRDFQTCLIKLSMTQCRLTRWATSIDLDKQIQAAKEQEPKLDPLSSNIPREQYDALIAWFQHIQDLIGKVQDKAKRYVPDSADKGKAEQSTSSRTSAAGVRGKLLNTASEDTTEQPSGHSFFRQHFQKLKQSQETQAGQTALKGETVTKDDALIASVSQKMHELSLRRCSDVSIVNKVWWALSDRNTLVELIDDLGNLATWLEDLFPGNVKQRQALTDEETKILKEVDGVKQIVESLIANNSIRDKFLADTLDHASAGKKSDSGNSVFNTTHQGPNYGTHLGQANFAGGSPNFGASVPESAFRRN